jgi:DNA-binding MarR family transcriptional regulator
LVFRGFIEFTDNPRPKRSKLAALTESGRIAFRQARQKENEIIEMDFDKPQLPGEQKITGIY